MPKREPGPICQMCGIEAPTRYVEFNQNVGMLMMRRSKSFKGNLCKSCLHKTFWKMTGTTAAVGWLGQISFFIAPYYIVTNAVRYAGALKMPPVPAGARAPELSDADIARLAPHAADLMGRLGEGESLNAVAADVAGRTGLTPGQVVTYAVGLAETGGLKRTAAAQSGGGRSEVAPAAGVAPPRPSI